MRINKRVRIQLLAILFGFLWPGFTWAENVLKPDDAQSIAKEAYIYGVPLVDNYRVMYSYFVDKNSPAYEGEWNTIINADQLATPKSLTVPAPNVDTVYSILGADLRAEPLVLSLPEAEAGRYYSLQFIDLYTFNFAYAGTRATEGKKGMYLLVGPQWQGAKPAGIDAVIRCETYFALVLYRTQVLNSGDFANVKKFQTGYKVMPLSRFWGQNTTTAQPQIVFPPPLSRRQYPDTVAFFNCLNFILGFCPVVPEEVDLRERFSRIGIQGGESFRPESFSQSTLTAIKAGVTDALKTFQEATRGARDDFPGQIFFGSREQLKGDYLHRMIGAVTGLYGNSEEEALYKSYSNDSTGNQLRGDQSYTLRFAPGEFPPVNAFWSLTMYRLPGRFLVANPLNRYMINSTMLNDLKSDADGGITFYIQQDSPGQDRESNWIPAPAGNFVLSLRLYLPRPEIYNRKWLPPSINPAQ